MLFQEYHFGKNLCDLGQNHSNINNKIGIHFVFCWLQNTKTCTGSYKPSLVKAFHHIISYHIIYHKDINSISLFCKESNLISRYFCPTEQTSLSPKFGVIVKGRKTDTGAEGDVVFLLSPSVMSSHSDSAYTKSWRTLSIHCRHGYSTASATLPAAETTGATQPAVGQCVRLTGALSNERAGE